MPLKPIPVEPLAPNLNVERCVKHFNPALKKKNGNKFSLKKLCLNLVHYINRGSKYTLEQIDDIIMALQRMILKLQKEKQELMIKKIRNRR